MLRPRYTPPSKVDGPSRVPGSAGPPLHTPLPPTSGSPGSGGTCVQVPQDASRWLRVGLGEWVLVLMVVLLQGRQRPSSLKGGSWVQGRRGTPTWVECPQWTGSSLPGSVHLASCPVWSRVSRVPKPLSPQVSFRATSSRPACPVEATGVSRGRAEKGQATPSSMPSALGAAPRRAQAAGQDKGQLQWLGRDLRGCFLGRWMRTGGRWAPCERSTGIWL